MSMRTMTFGGLALILLLTVAASGQEAEPAGTMACGDCHDQAAAFVTNPHVRGALENGAVPNGICESCHGDGTAHIEEGGDPTKISVPRGFAGATETCLSCHEAADDRRSHATGMHAASKAVNCLSCHEIHTTERHLVTQPQPALCATCHSTQAASFRNKPYSHRLREGAMACSTCHEPHGRPADNIRRTAAGESPCLGCHTDKRGPFVFQHGGTTVGDCATCHEPHGSVNPNQLRRTRVFQLCLECHSTITHSAAGSQPPAFHNLNNPRFQNCTTCHVAVHGSNRSPALLK